MRRYGIIVLGLFATACASAAPQGERACTLIGCEDGLRVAVTNEQPAGTIVRVQTEGRTLREFTCGANQPCETFVSGQTPELVNVVIISGATTHTYEFSLPEYTVVYPNGPDCPPACRQATITIPHK